MFDLLILDKTTTLESLRRRAAGQDRTLAAAALPQEQGNRRRGEDPALLALGEELNQLLADWKAEKESDDKVREAVHARVEAATGIAVEHAPPKDNDPTGYWKMSTEIWDSVPEYDPDLKRWAKLNDRLAALATAIFALTARTPAGLAIQAKVAVMDGQDPYGDYDFIDAVCRYAGVSPEFLAETNAPTEPRHIDPA